MKNTRMINVTCFIGVMCFGFFGGCETGGSGRDEQLETDSTTTPLDDSNVTDSTENTADTGDDTADTGDDDKNFIDANGVEWVYLEDGTFEMGIELEPGMSPVVEVSIKSFHMMKTEATIGQYKACLDDGSCTEPDKTDRCDPKDAMTDYTNWEKDGRDNYPVSCISWNQAFSFCKWLGGRLPSESEWEYAARSRGKQKTYPWGDEAPSCERVVMAEANPGCGEFHSWEVCSLPLGNTEQGICDMAGNVAEIVQDWIVFGYESLPNDGSAYGGDVHLSKGARGGSFLVGKSIEFANQNRPTIILDDEDDSTWAAGVRCAR